MKTSKRGAPLTGRVFHLLTPLRLDLETVRSTRNQHWWCVCACGRIVSVSRSNLLSRHTRSCGSCLRRSYTIPPDLETQTHA